MKIMILGASGQIGSVIYSALRASYEVVGTSRKESVQLIKFDPFEDDWSTLGKCQVIINCIGQIEATSTFSFYKIHVELTQLMLQNRKQIGNPRIIQISALGASTQHQVEFLRTKGIADDLLLEYPDTVVVRPSIVCTPNTMVVKKMLMLRQISQFTRGVLFVPKGFLDTQIQPIMPQDLGEIVKNLCTMNSLPNVIQVVGPDPITFRDIFGIMFAAQKEKFRLMEVSKTFLDMVIKYGVSVVSPRLINSQQYQLLFENNVGNAAETEKFLGHALTSTRKFFINEFESRISKPVIKCPSLS